MILSKRQENILVACVLLLICWVVWTRIIKKTEMFGGEELTMASSNKQLVSEDFLNQAEILR